MRFIEQNERFAWHSWNRARSILLSIRLDSCFGLVGPLQQPAIDSNVDPARNHLYQASAPAAGIQDSNVVMPPAAHSCAKRRAFEAHVDRTRFQLYTRQTSDSLSINRTAFFERGPLSKPYWRQRASKLYALRSCGQPEALLDSKRYSCLLYTSPSPRDLSTSRMPSSA